MSPEVDDATRQQWARRVVRSVLERSKEDISLDAAQASPFGAWRRRNGAPSTTTSTTASCTAARRTRSSYLCASTVHVADLEDGPHINDERRIEGGAFLVNSRGLNHYAECGYKGRLCANAFAGKNWHRVPYRRGRCTIHDGEWPHAAEETTRLPAGKRRVIGAECVWKQRRRGQFESPRALRRLQQDRAVSGRGQLAAG